MRVRHNARNITLFTFDRLSFAGAACISLCGCRFMNIDVNVFFKIKRGSDALFMTFCSPRIPAKIKSNTEYDVTVGTPSCCYLGQATGEYPKNANSRAVQPFFLRRCAYVSLMLHELVIEWDLASEGCPPHHKKDVWDSRIAPPHKNSRGPRNTPDKVQNTRKLPFNVAISQRLISCDYDGVAAIAEHRARHHGWGGSTTKLRYTTHCVNVYPSCYIYFVHGFMSDPGREGRTVCYSIFSYSLVAQI